MSSLPDIVQPVQSGARNPWLFLPLAVFLEAIQALEPGHSKSLMAGYIIAVKGTKPQAAFLGLSAAVGHSVVVWILAVAAIYFGDTLIVDKAEPWLELISGLLVIALAFRLYIMMRRPHDHDHDHGDDHEHDHGHNHRHAPPKRKHVSNFDIVWFGFTGGLFRALLPLPCCWCAFSYEPGVWPCDDIGGACHYHGIDWHIGRGGGRVCDIRILQL